MPKLTIDGKTVEVPKGTTIIQAARDAGIDVPHYCWHPGLSVAGNCRVCLVEIEGMGPLQIACNTQCADNMVVKTASAKARSGQEDVMELLLINHPLDCPICDQAGECKLQEYSFRLGHDRSRFDFPKVHKPKHVVWSGKVTFDAERCILCTRCVRFCAEVAKEDELDIANRGDRNTIVVGSGKSLENDYQMNVIDVCPVGALTSTDFRFKSRVWFLENANTVCAGCSRGCNVVAGARWGRILRLVPRENQAVNKWWMCDDGRFTYKSVAADDRLGAPMIRRDGALVEVGWEEALAAAAAGLEKAGASVAAVLSGSLTTEELWQAQRLLDKLGASRRCVPPRAFAKDDLLRTGDGNPNSRGASVVGLAEAAPSLAGAAAALVVGADVATDGVPFVVAIATHDTAAVRAAHVVLPGLTPYEKDGTFVNVTGRVQKLVPAVKAPGSAWPEWKILGALRNLLEREPRPRSAAEVFLQMAASVPQFAGMTHAKLGAHGLDVRAAAEAAV